METKQFILLKPRCFKNSKEPEVTESMKKFRSKYPQFDSQLSMRVPDSSGGFLCDNFHKNRRFAEIYEASVSNFTILSVSNNQSLKKLPLWFYTPSEIAMNSITLESFIENCQLSNYTLFLSPLQWRFSLLRYEKSIIASEEFSPFS